MSNNKSNLHSVMASLFVPASCFGGCLADCEVAGNKVREDDRWLMVSCDQTDGGYVCDTCH